MLKTLTSSMMFMNLIMMHINNPLMLGSMILLQIFLASYLIYMMSSLSWIPLTLMLMMVSGLMIIFLYMTSICSNNKFNYISKKTIWYSMVIIPIYFFSYLSFYNENFSTKDFNHFEFFNMYTTMNMKSSIFMFIYLLITLIMMINMLNKPKAPMRKKY